MLFTIFFRSNMYTSLLTLRIGPQPPPKSTARWSSIMVRENSLQGGGLVPVTIGEYHVPKRGTVVDKYIQLRPFTFFLCGLPHKKALNYLCPGPLDLQLTFLHIEYVQLICPPSTYHQRTQCSLQTQLLAGWGLKEYHTLQTLSDSHHRKPFDTHSSLWAP